VLLKRLFSIIERNLLIKKFIKEIIYSKENIKITFFYSENFKNFSLENSPARRQAGRASVSFESQESLNPINKEEFVFQSTAPDRILPKEKIITKCDEVPSRCIKTNKALQDCYFSMPAKFFRNACLHSFQTRSLHFSLSFQVSKQSE